MVTQILNIRNEKVIQISCPFVDYHTVNKPGFQPPNNLNDLCWEFSCVMILEGMKNESLFFAGPAMSRAECCCDKEDC